MGGGATSKSAVAGASCGASAIAMGGSAIVGTSTITFAIVVACALVSGVHARQLVAPRVGHACAPVRQHDIEQVARARDAIAPPSGVRRSNAIARDAAAPRIDASLALIAQRPLFAF